MTVIAVNPVSLQRAAGDIDAAAQLIADCLRVHDGSIAEGVQAGWASSGQLAAGAGTWRDYLSGLQAAMGGTAGDLRQLAADMQEADRHGRQLVGGRFLE